MRKKEENDEKCEAQNSRQIEDKTEWKTVTKKKKEEHQTDKAEAPHVPHVSIKDRTEAPYDMQVRRKKR